MIINTILKKIRKKKTSVRNTKEYRLWKQLVKHRDKHCVRCGETINLHAHHIFSFKEYPCLRTEVNNGITLCGNCHTEYHKQYRNTTPISLIKFLSRETYL